MNNKVVHLDNDFKIDYMKQVRIKGQLVNYSSVDTRQTLTEEVNPNFLGYSKEYWIDGKRYELSQPAKFYK
jgi:hypothetical protein